MLKYSLTFKQVFNLNWLHMINNMKSCVLGFVCIPSHSHTSSFTEGCRAILLLLLQVDLLVYSLKKKNLGPHLPSSSHPASHSASYWLATKIGFWGVWLSLMMHLTKKVFIVVCSLLATSLFCERLWCKNPKNGKWSLHPEDCNMIPDTVHPYSVGNEQ